MQPDGRCGGEWDATVLIFLSERTARPLQLKVSDPNITALAAAVDDGAACASR